MLLVADDAGDARKHLSSAEPGGGRVVGIAAYVVHGEGDFDGRVDLTVLHQVAAGLVHGAGVLGQVETHGAQLDALAAARALLENVEHDELLLQHGGAADVEAQARGVVVIAPDDAVVLDWLAVGATATVSTGRSLNVPLDVRMAGNQGNIVEVVNLEGGNK